jgi:peptidoglycan/xylan/chitin deacetylase (PgdA/CDA1 family)
VPNYLQNGLHNVKPEELYKQIKWLKKYFDIVEVDSLFSNDSDISGKAAITFDDGYQSVFREAFPVMKTLNVPATVFINGISLEGKHFWRDKIRFLINTSRVVDFLKYHHRFFDQVNISPENFFLATKNPDYNSKIINGLVDDYLEKNKITMDTTPFCVNTTNHLIQDPLISYGNHTYNHYVMSSLEADQQEEEIKKNINLLKRLNVKQSNIFSIPFGRNKDFNEDTIHLIKKYNYKGFLYSRNAINIKGFFAKKMVSEHSVLWRERYMVEPNFYLFQKQIKNILRKAIIHSCKQKIKQV